MIDVISLSHFHESEDSFGEFVFSRTSQGNRVWPDFTFQLKLFHALAKTRQLYTLGLVRPSVRLPLSSLCPFDPPANRNVRWLEVLGEFLRTPSGEHERGELALDFERVRIRHQRSFSRTTL